MTRLGPDETVPATWRTVEIDPEKFEAGVAAAARHAQPPSPPRELTADDVKERFRWTDDELEVAFSLGFPRFRRPQSRPGSADARLWLEAAVHEWVRRIKGLRLG